MVQDLLIKKSHRKMKLNIWLCCWHKIVLGWEVCENMNRWVRLSPEPEYSDKTEGEMKSRKATDVCTDVSSTCKRLVPECRLGCSERGAIHLNNYRKLTIKSSRTLSTWVEEVRVLSRENIFKRHREAGWSFMPEDTIEWDGSLQWMTWETVWGP